MTKDKKKGRWECEYGDFSGYFQCSECKAFVLYRQAVCPNCWAHMDGEGHERP